ncbi:DUF932 domain-containing protein [Streptomyces roseolus]|uniref:DUF932 domain-containing protein n=1 Tax=Streptomyces roseolus TaxID=67358 RepID=UPI001674FA0C|nr:DUF932 domain-containing protein [Streptomyces roseolus]GGR51884.1 hypothetical protein GCM10010282_51030 [Streptomyces roseolus]
MSRETLEWLSNNTLIGFTNKRGHAWHHRAGDDNWYPDAIPVQDVHKRLFSWVAEERTLYVPSGPGEPGALNGLFAVPGRKAIVRSDTGAVLGIFKDGYQPHQYGEWLLDNVATILDDSLMIGSAGLLKGGAVAWVSVEMPDTVETREGVRFRPFLMACTSFDGSIATTYKEVVTNVVCDNTMTAALGEKSSTVKVRHSAKSLTRIQSVRDALGIVHKISDDFQAEVARLTAVKVDDATWERIVADIVPMPDDPAKEKRAATMATTKRDAIMRLWRHDERVAPWAGTAFGAWQAFNTHAQHEGIVRGMSRQERNMLSAVNGTIETSDADTVRRILALTA